MAIVVSQMRLHWLRRKEPTDKVETDTMAPKLKPWPKPKAVKKGKIDRHPMVAGEGKFRVVKSNGSYRELSDLPTAERVARADSEAGYDVKIIKV